MCNNLSDLSSMTAHLLSQFCFLSTLLNLICIRAALLVFLPLHCIIDTFPKKLNSFWSMRGDISLGISHTVYILFGFSLFFLMPLISSFSNCALCAVRANSCMTSVFFSSMLLVFTLQLLFLLIIQGI